MEGKITERVFVPCNSTVLHSKHMHLRYYNSLFGARYIQVLTLKICHTHPPSKYFRLFITCPSILYSLPYHFCALQPFHTLHVSIISCFSEHGRSTVGRMACTGTLLSAATTSCYHCRFPVTVRLTHLYLCAVNLLALWPASNLSAIVHCRSLKMRGLSFVTEESICCVAVSVKC